MSKHMDAIRKHLNGTPIRAAGEAMGLAVVVTDDELITLKVRVFGSPTIERFPLSTVTSVRFVPNPSTNLLAIEFASSPPRSLTLMYSGDDLADFEKVISVVRAHGSTKGG